MSKERKRFDLQLYLRREPVVLAVLTGLAIVLFAAVTGLSTLHRQQQDSFAARWSTRGMEDLNAKRYKAAVVDFRTSLLYSRGNYDYQFKLAEALIGENRTSEAYAYLASLWDDQPENGLVNLELARIEAARGQTNSAIRYYQNAIYGVWPGNQDVERRDTQLELIHMLLHIGEKAQADSELIALAANLGPESVEHVSTANLFLKVGESQRALDQFRLALASNRRDVNAMAGAGNAAFQLGQYGIAERYLRQAKAASDEAVESQLRIAELVLQMDPFRGQFDSAQDDRIVMNAFVAAGLRLKACSLPEPLPVPTNELAILTQSWKKMKPQITMHNLRRDPDMVNTAMGLVFQIEHQTSGLCGGSTDSDDALLLIANLHQGL